MEWLAISIMVFLIYIGLNPVWHWTEKQDREYLLKKATYMAWLKQSYYVIAKARLNE